MDRKIKQQPELLSFFLSLSLPLSFPLSSLSSYIYVYERDERDGRGSMSVVHVQIWSQRVSTGGRGEGRRGEERDSIRPWGAPNVTSLADLSWCLSFRFFSFRFCFFHSQPKYEKVSNKSWVTCSDADLSLSLAGVEININMRPCCER